MRFFHLTCAFIERELLAKRLERGVPCRIHLSPILAAAAAAGAATAAILVQAVFRIP